MESASGSSRRTVGLSALRRRIKDADTRRLFIAYPHLNHIIYRIRQGTSSLGAVEPHCVFVAGETGTGKSTLISHLYGHIKPIHTSDGLTVPVLSFPLRAKSSIRMLAEDMLRGLGDPYVDARRVGDLQWRVSNLLTRDHTELIVMDELQHFIQPGTDRVIRDASEWLKDLIIRTSIPLVAFGQPSAKRIFEASPQLSRRFPIREEILPFKVDNEEGMAQFARLLMEMDRYFPVADELFTDRDTVDSFWKATKGIMHYVTLLFTEAARKAAAEKRSVLSKADFYMAYEDFMKHTIGPVNPLGWLVKKGIRS